MERWWFGRSLCVDVQGCNRKLITSPKEIRRFVQELVEFLDMVRVGPTIVKRFGEGRLRGYSMMQFIETSSITAHFDETVNRAFIDIFSCKEYDTKGAANFCKNFFSGSSMSTHARDRI